MNEFLIAMQIKDMTDEDFQLLCHDIAEFLKTTGWFERASLIDIIGAIVKSDIDWIYNDQSLKN